MKETIASSEPFDGLDFGAVDWAALTHAYGSAEAVRVQISSVAAELVPLLGDPDRDVRRAVLRILAVCPAAQVRRLADLRRFDDEDAPRLRAPTACP